MGDEIDRLVDWQIDNYVYLSFYILSIIHIHLFIFLFEVSSQTKYKFYVFIETNQIGRFLIYIFRKYP